MDSETDKLVKESKDNAEKARRGMIWNKWRWVWPEHIPNKVRRRFRPSAKPENRRKKGVGKISGPRLCDCGNEATKKKNNADICDRCDEIEKRMAHMLLKH